jgi:hypothetical protein
VKVTVLPLQIDVVLATIETVGVTVGFTVIFKVFDVAEVGVAQTAFEVSTTVTASLLIKVEEVNVLLFVPAFTPFTFH